MAIKKVEEELDEDSSDSIDHSIAQTEAKKRKVCVNGHMNENVRGNRIKCKTCKSMLKDVLVSSTTNAIEDTLEVETLKCKSKSILHHPIDNVILENKPEVKSMGAIPVNPNTPARIDEVLETVQKQSGIYRKYSTKLVFSDSGTFEKVVCTGENHERKFIIVTADGLPYKQMIKLISDIFICISCEKELKQIADMTKHMKEHNHKELYQKFGTKFPNIGQFHY